MSKKLVSLFLALLMMTGMAAALAEDAAISITDMYGRQIALTEPVTRLIALSASDCEILYALDSLDLLVGRGKYCDYPESLSEIPAVESGADTNLEEILALNPQVILMSDMAQAEALVNLLEENGVKVVLSRNTDIEGAYDAIAMVGALVGKEDEAAALVASMKETFADIAAHSPNEGKTVYFEVSPLQWGLYTAGTGTFMDEIARMCGLTNAFADIEGWAPVSEEQVLARNPDYIVSVSGIPEADAEIMARAGWDDVTAVAKGDVFNADANAFSRPGPRLKDAAQSLYRFINDLSDSAEELAE